MRTFRAVENEIEKLTAMKKQFDTPETIETIGLRLALLTELISIYRESINRFGQDINEMKEGVMRLWEIIPPVTKTDR